MEPTIAAPEIDGAQTLADWFGQWPSFHDAEILTLSLRRAGSSLLRVHTWGWTGLLDSKGFYERDRHVVVEFEMAEIVGLKLADFSSQNVISGLTVGKASGDLVTLVLGGCYGLFGNISCRKVTVRFAPGNPSPNE